MYQCFIAIEIIILNTTTYMSFFKTENVKIFIHIWISIGCQAHNFTCILIGRKTKIMSKISICIPYSNSIGRNIICFQQTNTVIVCYIIRHMFHFTLVKWFGVIIVKNISFIINNNNNSVIKLRCVKCGCCMRIMVRWT